MNNQIWKIKDKKLNNTNLFLYSEFIKKKYKIEIENDFNKVWKWSVENPRYFWKSIWDFTGVKGKLGKVFLIFQMYTT